MENITLPSQITEAITTDDSRAPDGPNLGPGAWVRKNLFSSVSNTIQTIIFTAILVGALRWLMSVVFADDALWSSVWTNMRLLFIYNYPAEQIIRIWFSLGVILAAVAITLAAFNLGPRIKLRSMVHNLLVAAAILSLFGVVAPEGAPRLELFAVGVISAAVLGAILLVDRRFNLVFSFTQALVLFALLVVAVVWLVPFGQFLFVDGEAIHKSGTVSMSTKVPWTIMMAILAGTYVVAKLLLAVIPARPVRGAMAVFWVFGPAFLVFLVLRDPAFDWDHVWSTDVPMALGFIVGGGILLYFLSEPGRAELARVVGAVAFGFALFNWVAAFMGWYPMLQKARISFLLLALFLLAVPTFSGERAARFRLVSAWVGLMAISHWLITGINTESTVDIVAPPILGGFTLTLVLAYYVMLASFPLGILLALARTSKMPIFRVLATTYIEAIRGIPLITILFFFSIMLNLFLPPGMAVSELAAIFTGYTLFSGAYMAENVRGGLQSVRQGQFEASDAIGLTTVQRTIFIVLPQALRVSIPNIVGQAIATFKETSLVAVVGGFELLRISRETIPNQPGFLGQTKPAFLFISLVYFVFAYAMSRSSRNLEAKLGVGTR